MGGKGEKWIMERKKKLKGLATKENKGSERRQQVKQTKRKRDGGNKDVMVENRKIFLKREVASRIKAEGEKKEKQGGEKRFKGIWSKHSL